MKAKWEKRAMTPTALGCVLLVLTALAWLRKSAWRPYLEAVLFLFGATIGFGGLGIALRNHVAESGKDWGWAGLVSHWPSNDTWESVFWHGWPAAIALAVAGHWWWRFHQWLKEHRNADSRNT